MIPSVGRIIHVSRTSEPAYKTPATERVDELADNDCRPAIICRIVGNTLLVNVFWLRGPYAAWAMTWHDPRECPNETTSGTT